MFSRQLKIIAIILTLFLTACSLKIGEEPPPQSLGELASTACITEASEALRKFALGDGRSYEVTAAFDCLSGAFEKFGKYVRGRDEARFDVSELAQFIEKYFISKDGSGQPINKFSPGLQTEMMRLKQLFLGGSLQYVTRDELRGAMEILKRLKNMAVNINPYMKVYTLNWKVTNDRVADSKYFEEANVALQNFATDLSGLITTDHPAYQFTDFVGFLTQVSTFYSETWSFIDKVNHYLPLVYKVKKIISGGTEQAISAGEWKSFLLLGARSYIQYNRYYYFLDTSIHSTTSLSLGYMTRELEDLFSVFEDSIRAKAQKDSKSTAAISRDELDELLKALSDVWSDFRVSPALVDEVMVVKQVLIGGSKSQWSADDFSNAKKKVLELRPLLEKFFPYFSVYSLEWNPAIYDNAKAEAFFKEAQDSLSQVMLQLGTLLEAPYSLTHLYQLMNEIEKLYPNQAKSGEPVPAESLDATLKKYLPLFQNIKNLLFEDTDDVIQKSQWPQFLSLNSDLYSIYLNYYYFTKGRSLKEPQGLFAATFLVQNTVESFQKLLNIKPTHVIADREMMSLLFELQKVKIIPEDFKADTLTKVVNSVLKNLLNPPERRLKGILPRAFDQEHLNTLRDETFTWIETELFLRSVFLQNNNEITLPVTELKTKIESKLQEATISTTLKLGLIEMQRVLASPVPLIVDNETRLAISGRLQPIYTSDSLSRMNLTRAISRLLVRSYGVPLTDSELDHGRKKGILVEGERLTKDQALNAFNDLKWAAIDLKFLDPANLTFIDARFMEANIFGPRGNGDNFVSFLELSDLLGMILSGVRLDTMMRADLLSECLSGVEAPGTTSTVSYDCLYKNYRKNIPVNFVSVPDFLKFINSNEACDTEIAFFNILKTAGYIPNAKKQVKLGDIALFPHVTQYLEMTFAKFDLNHDQRLDKHEAQIAFPVFRPLFKEMAADYIKKGLLSEKDLFPLFTFVLKNGKIPAGVGDLVKFFFWKKGSMNFTSDRNQLASILGVLSDQSNKAKPKNLDIELPSPEIMMSHISKT